LRSRGKTRRDCQSLFPRRKTAFRCGACAVDRTAHARSARRLQRPLATVRRDPKSRATASRQATRPGWKKRASRILPGGDAVQALEAHPVSAVAEPRAESRSRIRILQPAAERHAGGVFVGKPGKQPEPALLGTRPMEIRPACKLLLRARKRAPTVAEQEKQRRSKSCP